MQLNLILEVKSQEMDKIFSESELLEFLKERLTIEKIDNIKILSAGVINAITVGECDFPSHFIKCLHENGIYYIYELQKFGYFQFNDILDKYFISGECKEILYHTMTKYGINFSDIDMDCRNPDCYRFEYQLTDQMIIGSVLTVLNMAIANPSLIESNDEIIMYSPTADVIRKQNEISQMTDSAQIDFDRVKSELFRLAEMKYECCTYDDNPQKTTQIRSLLENYEQLNSLDIGLFKVCISRIWISHFCTIEVEFINGVHIKNITERTGENHEHSAQCDSDSCESTNRNQPQ